MANPYVYYRMEPGALPPSDPRYPIRKLDWRRDLPVIRRFYARFTDTPVDPDALGPAVGDPMAILSDGEIVSFAIPLSFREGETEIGGVATVPEWRNRGCCKALIAAMARGILSGGLAATLTTHRDNLPMRAAAASVGMAEVPHEPD